MTPKRVKARTAGVTGYVNVMRPTKWGNPFDWRQYGKAEAVRLHSEWIVNDPAGQAIGKDAVVELRGRDLGCTCKIGEPCHGDVLLRIANAEVIR
jgi:hypothetical protein